MGIVHTCLVYVNKNLNLGSWIAWIVDGYLDLEFGSQVWISNLDLKWNTNPNQ